MIIILSRNIAKNAARERMNSVLSLVTILSESSFMRLQFVGENDPISRSNNGGFKSSLQVGLIERREDTIAPVRFALRIKILLAISISETM